MLRSMVLHHGGFPIRKSTDIMLICSSPWLIAACHVLLRLLMPRHSPCALIRLNFWTFVPVLWIAWVSKQIDWLSWKGFPLTLRFFHLREIVSFTQFLGKTYTNLLKLISVLLSVRFYSFFFIRFSMIVVPFRAGWHKWTRTTDLALIRRAL